MRSHPKSLLFQVLLFAGLLLAAGSSLPGAASAPPPGGQGYIGIRFQKVTQEFVWESKLPDKNGLLITEVPPQSPAAAAGLKEGDVLIEFDGKETADDAGFRAAIRQLPPEKQLAVKFVRDGQIGTTTVTLGETPPAVAYFRRGSERSNIGDLPGAIADYTEAIRLDPKNAEGYFCRGLVKANGGVQNSGRKPRRSEVAAAQKRSAEALADFTEASRLYTEVLRVNPNNSLAYEYRATARDQMGDKDGATQDRATSAKIKEQVAFAKFHEEVTRASLSDLLASSDKTESQARERNRAIIAAKNQQLPAMLRERKTDELSAFVVKIEQTILDLNHESEVAKDRAQQATATNGDAHQIAELRGLAISYRERIELLKPILTALKEEIANRNR